MAGGEAMGRDEEQACDKISNTEYLRRLYEHLDEGQREEIRDYAIGAMHAVRDHRSENIRDAWIESVLIKLLNLNLIDKEGL